MQKLSVLVLDDELRVREEINEFLQRQDCRTFLAERPSDAFKVLQNNDIDIAIVDIRLPEMNGIEVLERIKEQHPGLEVIMISGHGDMATVIEAFRKGATDYFAKPFRLAELQSAIHRTQRFLKLNHQLSTFSTSLNLLSEKLYSSFGTTILGESSEIKNVIKLMEKVAQTDSTSILITGESGTGKELVAHGIHYMSRRSKHLFHSVNCSAITDSLFESEFFGHKKGSFTGAYEERQGWFEISNKGTLFLDEISDMPLGQQAKLLRVLEDKKISRVGSHQSVEVDVRVIAASNRNLDQLMEEKKFRNDLYHRLSTFIIQLPPLRERKADIPILLNHFVQDFSNKMNKKIEGLEAKLIDSFLDYHYPGNIRELRNMVERAVILCEGNRLKPEHFSFYQRRKTVTAKTADETLDINLVEQQLIKRALEKSGHNKSKAAQLLNITWQTLDRRIKKYGLEEA